MTTPLVASMSYARFLGRIDRPNKTQHTTTEDSTMTTEELVNYFAAHAPEVPDWFTHEPIPEPAKPPLPDGDDLRQYCRSWFKDPCWDIEECDKLSADELEIVRRFIAAARDYWKANGEWKQRNETARMVQWAFYYGRVMAAESKRYAN
jgi:hypothetical protein